ncbi:MAG: phage tail sheath family protein [Verrucomicrobia bacterium]|nr:MAG: phage tail sheath family protein [Verrucomicrobiota bacterium]
MPTTVSYPGVYVEELASGVRTITGVGTSVTAFLGRAPRGQINEPTTIFSFGDFERQFGGLGVEYPLSYAVRDFYANGGGTAIIVRLEKNSAPAEQNDIKLEAASPGIWGNALVYVVDSEGITEDVSARFGIAKADLFNLTIYDDPGKGAVERFLNVAITTDAGSRRLDRVLADESNLVRVQLKSDGTPRFPGARPTDSTPEENPADPAADKTKFQTFSSGDDGAALTTDDDVLGKEDKKTGMFALAKADLFNLLCIPPDSRDDDTRKGVYQRAMEYCVQRRAMLIVDPPVAWGTNPETAAATAKAKLSDLGLTGPGARNAALYFPRVIQPDPARDGQLDVFVPCGIVAGVMARTDTDRGVWKAPAGLDASVNGVAGLQVNLNDAENGQLNPLGINCLRYFPPVAGRVVWGARTLRGADQLADEYKYVPVRRLALFLEESLYRGTQWAVFEPNDEPLWAQLRLNIGAFMHDLFRKGAFAGQTPREAYFVKCDRETTTQSDVNLGIVNVLIGFAPLKPAEFVILKFQQMAGQIAT